MMASQSPLPPRRDTVRNLLLAAAATFWAAFIGWRAWSHWPRLPLDSAGDDATRAAYDAASAAYLTKAIVIGVAGLALLLAIAALAGRRRAEPGAAPIASTSWTGPSRILLMRHAEKTGDVEDIHLSDSGRQRAQRLATYIPETFGAPDFIFAAARSRRSIRSIETMQPLAAALGKEVRFDIEDRDFPDLVEALKTNPAYRGALVVVCWHHGKLPEIAAELGARAGEYPREWPDGTFDLILNLDYRRGVPPAVTQISEPF
ncbi:MAG: histidine phosphatase family protein [Hyphomicrobium sp.]